MKENAPDIANDDIMHSSSKQTASVAKKQHFLVFKIKGFKMQYIVKAWYNEDGKRTGWAVWGDDDFVVDIFPTKKQAIDWIKSVI